MWIQHEKLAVQWDKIFWNFLQPSESPPASYQKFPGISLFIRATGRVDQDDAPKDSGVSTNSVPVRDPPLCSSQCRERATISAIFHLRRLGRIALDEELTLFSNRGGVSLSTSTHFQTIATGILWKRTRRLNSIMARNSRFRENFVLPNDRPFLHKQMDFIEFSTSHFPSMTPDSENPRVTDTGKTENFLMDGIRAKMLKFSHKEWKNIKLERRVNLEGRQKNGGAILRTANFSRKSQSIHYQHHNLRHQISIFSFRTCDTRIVDNSVNSPQHIKQPQLMRNHVSQRNISRLFYMTCLPC